MRLVLKAASQMMASTRMAIYLAFLTALAGTALGQNVQTDFDHQADFSQYKTYQWQTVLAADSLWETRIENAVNGQLSAKGWAQLPTNNSAESNGSTQPGNGAQSPLPPPPPVPQLTGFPQLTSLPQLPASQPKPKPVCVTSAPCVVIVAFQATQNRKSLQAFYDGMGGWRPGGSMGEATVSEQDFKEGTLVVNMYDAKTKQILWHGAVEGTLSDKADKNEKNLNKAVAKMFKNFPPGSTKR
jgi:hypothetical protein